MGLDMYLYRDTYVGNPHSELFGPEELGITFPTSHRFAKNFGRINQKKIVSIREEVGYWRKANQIHQWFVENVQDGRDECEYCFVPREKLEELRELCRRVKSTPVQAGELLPTQSGFFFGSVEYDEGYQQDIDHTLEILDAILGNPEEQNGDADYYYHSSW